MCVYGDIFVYICVLECLCLCVNDAHMQHIITYESVRRRPPPLKFESRAEISESGQGESYNIFGICATTSQITATHQKIQKQPPLVGLNMFWDLMSPGKPNNKPQHYHFYGYNKQLSQMVGSLGLQHFYPAKICQATKRKPISGPSLGLRNCTQRLWSRWSPTRRSNWARQQRQ